MLFQLEPPALMTYPLIETFRLKSTSHHWFGLFKDWKYELSSGVKTLYGEYEKPAIDEEYAVKLCPCSFKHEIIPFWHPEEDMEHKNYEKAKDSDIIDIFHSHRQFHVYLFGTPVHHNNSNLPHYSMNLEYPLQRFAIFNTIIVVIQKDDKM